MSVNIKALKTDIKMTLCKVNRDILGEVPSCYIENITRYIDDIDTIEFIIPMNIADRDTFKSTRYLIYDLIKKERLVMLNEEEYFVIKEIEYDEEEQLKRIKAYSLEHKLNKNDINIEDIGFYLFEKDEEKDIYSLSDYMYAETGWKLGHVDESVQYDTLDDGSYRDKLRWQENVNTRWYDYIINNVAESFNCIPIFNTLKKEVDLYDSKTIGEDILIYLSYDNYIKSLNRSDDSLDIVTRLYLVGNEELDIISVTPTGYPYIEDYSYFIDNDEMSDNLIFAIKKYSEMIEIRTVIWKKLVKEKQDKLPILTKCQTDLFQLYTEIEVLKKMFNVYDSKEDEENKAITASKITELDEKKKILEKQRADLEVEISSLQSSIDEINILCKRETATDENGSLIFNIDTLDELKEFVYCDTYTNDSIMTSEDLLEIGRSELNKRCGTTVKYNLSVVDFTKRIIDNGFRSHWSGLLSLGNVIALKEFDSGKETLQYFVGYSWNPNEEDSLTLTISDKKTNKDDALWIGDRLRKTQKNIDIINSKQYLWIKQKYNRIGLQKGVR